MIYNRVDPDIAVDAAAYLYLPLLVFLPVFVFASGIVLFLHASNCRRRVLPPALIAPAAALVLLTTILQTGIFDIFAVSSPLVLSPLACAGGIGRIIARRAVVFSAGIALCGAATLLSPRPRQARAAYVAVRGIAALGATATVLLSFAIVSSQGRGMRVRERMRKTGTTYGVGSAIAVTDCDLLVRHEGQGIDCTARMRIANGGSREADSYIFNLNPGLEITSVSSARGGCRRKRETHVIVVTPPRPLLPGSVDTLEFAYRGRIDEEAMYQYAAEQDRGDTKRENAYTFLRHARRYAFVEPGMVLLVPAAGWYPRAGAGFDPGDPSRRRVDFTRYSLDVTVAESLVPLSQGGSRDAGGGRWIFAPETPLAGISLVAAPYRTRSVSVDSVTYRCHTFRDHDIGDRIFRALGDTIGPVVRGIREDMERKYGLVRVAGDAMQGEGRAPAPVNLSALETGNMSLTKKSIRSLAADAAVDRQSRAGVVVKGAWLFRCLEASIGDEAFTGLLDSALIATAFERLDGDALLDEIGKLARIDAQDFLAE